METNVAQEYVAATTATEEEIIPANLPIANPVIGYQSIDATTKQDEPVVSEESDELNALENQAHTQKVLLSSDAMRYFISKVLSPEDRTAVLSMVIEKARVSFPSEDGWVVLNLSRMEELMDSINADHDEIVSDDVIELGTFTHTAPITSGSLAEAIVSGNTLAAYEMISHRPMVALADAAADIDAVFRARKGEILAVSNMLKAGTVKLSDEQLTTLIAALTSALDGTYPDEESAVKMAILKAIKIVG